MITVLEYLVIAAAIGAVVFVVAVFVFGRGERMAPLPAQTSPAELPDRGITAQDVYDVKLAMALRGYRMSDVDWVLERLALRIDELSRQLAESKGTEDSADLVVVPVGAELFAGAEELPAGFALGSGVAHGGSGGSFGTGSFGTAATTSAELDEAESVSDALAYGAPPALSDPPGAEPGAANMSPIPEPGHPEPGARHRPRPEDEPS